MAKQQTARLDEILERFTNLAKVDLERFKNLAKVDPDTRETQL